MPFRLHADVKLTLSSVDFTEDIILYNPLLCNTLSLYIHSYFKFSRFLQLLTR